MKSMPINNIIQPQIIKIDENLRLVSPNKSDWKKAIPWYHNSSVLYYSEGTTDKVYDMDTINRMYEYLSNIGELYFIEVIMNNEWAAIGDVTLSEINMPIVLGDEGFWGRGIGKKVIKKLIERAKEIAIKRICVPTIYEYNHRSQNLFRSLGFIEIKDSGREKSFELRLD
jgi:RimJ/RimL family protein N-acetyltransferase